MRDIKIKTPIGVIALSIMIVASLILLLFSELTLGLLQTLFFIVGMALLWYSSHSLSHYIFARIFGISTLYFYIGKSELRKIKSPFSKLISKFFVTVGTKLDMKKFSSMNATSRGLIMGSGVIASTLLSLLVLIYGIFRGYNMLALLLGGLFFFVNLATEILFSVKAGDLRKMKEELAKNS